MLALVDEHFSAPKTSLNGIDLHDAQFQMRMQLNHIAGYTEMLREEALEDGNDGFLGDLDHIGDAQRNVVWMLYDIGQNLVGDNNGEPHNDAPGKTITPTSEAAIAGIGGGNSDRRRRSGQSRTSDPPDGAQRSGHSVLVICRWSSPRGTTRI